MDTRIETLATEFMNRKLTNGQALAEAFRERYAYLNTHPYMTLRRNPIQAAQEFAGNVVTRLVVLRRETDAARADTPPTDAEVE